MPIAIRSGAENFVHEYRLHDGRFEHRFLRDDGTEHADGSSEWQKLNDGEILDRWKNRGTKLRKWLEENGYERPGADQ